VRRSVVGALAALGLVACSSGSSSAAPSATPPGFRAAATAYLLGLDQLRVPDFTVDEPPHSVGETVLGAGDAQLALALRAAGLQDAATVRYFRDVADLATSNQFIDVRSTVMRFDGPGAAHRAYLAEVRHTDAVRGIVPVSTDALGDEAHGAQVTAVAPEGVQVVEVTLIVRNDNLVELLVVRGRLGGTGLSDALVLGHRWLAGQQ
jgi:hypothetical protein